MESILKSFTSAKHWMAEEGYLKSSGAKVWR